MKVEQTPLAGLALITLDVYNDERGFFVERFNQQKFSERGLPINFVQDNHSLSKPGVVRGLHGQHTPAQGKLVGAVRGAIWDVAVDIRPDSKTLGQYFAVELTASNGKLLWIPAGFAHGFCVLGDEYADVLYKTDALFGPGGEFGISWNDPELAIAWPVKDAIVSTKDQNLPSFKEYLPNPPKW